MQAFKPIRPHGHVAAVLLTIKKIGLDSIISSENTRQRRLVLSMIAARIIAPKSKLATARGLQEATKLSRKRRTIGIVWDRRRWTLSSYGLAIV